MQIKILSPLFPLKDRKEVRMEVAEERLDEDRIEADEIRIG